MLDQEEKIKSELLAAFGFLDGRIIIKRERRLWVDVSLDRFLEVFDFAVKKLNFTILCIITGLDEGENLGFVYHIARENGTILNLHTTAPKTNPVIRSITEYFPAGHIYERELVDLLGAKVEGLPPGPRYPLPDDWPEGQYPLRKDWSPEQLNKKEG